MRKKLANNKLSVRININTPTPYLKNNLKLLIPKNCDKKNILDIGCGNGRNRKHKTFKRSVTPGLIIGREYS